MSYQSKIDAQLRKAFVLAKDLAKPGIFSKKQAQGFDFGTGSVTLAAPVSDTAKIIVTKTVKDKTTITKTLMVQSSEIQPLGLYSTVVFDGETWTVGDSLKDSGYILMFEVFRNV